MNIQSVIEQPLSPGIISIDSAGQVFTHKLRPPPLSPADNAMVLDLASPLYNPGATIDGVSKIYDRSGYGTNLALTAVAWEQLPRGLWVTTYNGSTSVAKYSALFRGSDTSGSMAIWFKTIGTSMVLIGASDEAGTANYFWFYLHSDGRLIVDSRIANATDRVVATTAANDGAWHLGVMTSSGTAWLMYLDGASEGLSVLSGANTGEWFGDNATLDNFTLGAGDRGSLALVLDGSLALARVWTSILTATQILGLYNQERHLFGV